MANNITASCSATQSAQLIAQSVNRFCFRVAVAVHLDVLPVGSFDLKTRFNFGAEKLGYSGLTYGIEIFGAMLDADRDFFGVFDDGHCSYLRQRVMSEAEAPPEGVTKVK